MIREIAVGTGLLVCMSLVACGAGERSASSGGQKREQTRTESVTCSAPRPDRDLVEAVNANLRSNLQTIRAQIKLYNSRNPATPYDVHSPFETFWHPLIEGTYLSQAPMNPLQHSARVGHKPARGIGWVWAEETPGDPRTLSIYAVDENGDWFDESARYRRSRAELTKGNRWDQEYQRVASEQRCKGYLSRVRAEIRALNARNGTYPTLEELMSVLVMQGGIPDNPYNGDCRIVSATTTDAASRKIVGSGGDWAYYDGSAGGFAVFYANTRAIGENTW